MKHLKRVSFVYFLVLNTRAQQHHHHRHRHRHRLRKSVERASRLSTPVAAPAVANGSPAAVDGGDGETDTSSRLDLELLTTRAGSDPIIGLDGSCEYDLFSGTTEFCVRRSSAR
mmetsp:Transcript_718/g.1867  ORF Transcript_718/g.1867 Transcript_718/m.1867 type:complete len:114 (-) Transcript_718:1768-2109(-)